MPHIFATETRGRGKHRSLLAFGGEERGEHERAGLFAWIVWMVERVIRLKLHLDVDDLPVALLGRAIARSRDRRDRPHEDAA